MDEITGLHPWEQRDDEDEKAFRAFKVWRDLPYTDGIERTKLSVARRVGRSQNIQSVPGNINRWFDAFDWRERVKPYDRHMDARQREALAAARDRVATSRGTTIADLESEMIQESVGVLKLIHDKLQTAQPEEVAMREIPPMLKAVTGVHETVSKLKIAQSENDGKEKPAEPLSDAEMVEIFGEGSA